MAALADEMGDPAHMIGPFLRCRRNRRGRIEAVPCALAHVERGSLDQAFGVRTNRHDGLAVDCAGQHQPVVVIDMLADQVDPSGRGVERARGLAIGGAVARDDARDQGLAAVHARLR